MIPHGILKEFALAFLFIAAHTVCFWLWKDTMPVMVSAQVGGWWEFTAPALALLGAAMLFGMAALLLTNPWMRVFVFIAAGGLPFGFIPAWNGIVFIMIGVVILVLFAAHRIKQEYMLSLGFSSSKIMRAGLPLYFTVTALVLSLYYFTEVGDRDSVSAVLPRPLFNAAIEAVF